MRDNIWAVIKASAITLVGYIALYTLWGAIVNEITGDTLKLFTISLVSAVAFAYFLLRSGKNERLKGEREIAADYADRTYTSVVNDLKLALRREAKLLICIVMVVFVCGLLHGIDKILGFEKRVLSLPAFIFAPMCLFSELIKIPFVGYVVSAVVDCIAYIVLLLIYRKRTYARIQSKEKARSDKQA